MIRRCAELGRLLISHDWLANRAALRAWLDTTVEAEECVAAGLKHSSDAADWSLFERYVLAAHHRPSRSYTKTLCEVLDMRSDEINNEDIVDVMAEIRDPMAVDCLERALGWHPPWDDYGQLAVKCVWALAATGTPEALEIVREAASCGAAEVREAALQQLKLTDG